MKHATNTCPLPADTPVRVYLAPDDSHVGLAGEFYWGPGLGPEGEGRIERYEVLPAVAATPALRAA